MMNPELDRFFTTAKNWQAEMSELRKIVVGCGLEEERKWYQPCYTLEGKNIAIISSFKDYCIVGLFKGALLKDPQGILVRAGQNTQSGRQIRFTSVSEIRKLAPVIKSYLKEAIALEKSGAKIEYKKTDAYPVPDELTVLFRKSAAFKKAFEALTPGRQRGYLLFFSAAKQSTTRTARIEKYRSLIMAGKGMMDR